MSTNRFVIAATLAATAASPVLAKTAIYPVPTGSEVARFHNGVPTLDLETATGGVEITPLPFDHGHVTFGIAIYNKIRQPSNFGIENISANVGGTPLPVLSEQELEKRAKSRAMWSQIGIAMLAGAAAAAASTAHTTDHYYGRVRTPHGTYAWSAAYRDNSIGVLGATAASAAGVAGIVGVQNRLDYTLQNLGQEIVQTTTVEGDASYGGRIVIEKPKGDMKTPYDMRIAINLNGQTYPFVFRITDEGKNLPAAYPPPPSMPVPPQAAATAAALPGAPTVTPAVLVAPGASPYDAGRAAGAAAAAASAPPTS
jgi:hypothetical protein